MKYSIAFLFCLMLFQMSFAKNEKEKYPQEIVRLGLTKKYDKAKWFLYCIHCDQKLLFFSKKPSNETSTSEITFGILPLKLDKILVRHDTVEINFYWYYKGSKVNEQMILNYPTWGVVFVGNSDSIVLYSSRSTGRYFWRACEDYTKCDSRLIKPLQPEVIKYIKQNKNKLDPWFRQEAIKRGVIR